LVPSGGLARGLSTILFARRRSFAFIRLSIAIIVKKIRLAVVIHIPGIGYAAFVGVLGVSAACTIPNANGRISAKAKAVATRLVGFDIGCSSSS
jgi:hypothetical protein